MSCHYTCCGKCKCWEKLDVYSAIKHFSFCQWYSQMTLFNTDISERYGQDVELTEIDI